MIGGASLKDRDKEAELEAKDDDAYDDATWLEAEK